MVGVFLFFDANVTNAQCNQKWEWQNPLPQGNDLNDIQAINPDTLFAVGDHATLIKSYDGGKNWSINNCLDSSSSNLNGVHFVDSFYGWVVGNNGVVFHTSNGGKTWNEQVPPASTNLNAVYFADRDTGWAVGGDPFSQVIIHTTDGGATWKRQGAAGAVNLKSVYFIDNETGWAVGDENNTDQHILHTDDGGQNWNVQDSFETWKSSDLSNFTSVYFADSANGWALGKQDVFIEQLVFHTDNGGKSWKVQDTLDRAGDMHTVQFRDSLNGWILANPGVYATSNGGKSWKEISRLPVGGLFKTAGHFINANNGWVVGRGGVIYNTENGGRQWQYQSGSLLSNRLSIDFSGAKKGWAVGSDGGSKNIEAAYQTQNYGIKWKPKMVLKPSLDYTFNAIYFSTSLHGWIVANQNFGKNYIVHTTDGGNTWKKQDSNASWNYKDVYFQSKDTGWVVGENGHILHTNDGGITWDSQYSKTSEQLKAVHFVSKDTGWAVGGGFNSSVVVHTNDGGDNWIKQSINASGRLNDVYFTGKNNGWIVGNGGNIYQTDNGGRNWQSQFSNVQQNLNAVHFIDSLNGWVAGRNGLIFYTTNGGDVWQQMESGTNQDLNDLYFKNPFGWVTGADGSILRFRCSNEDSLRPVVCRNYTVPSGDTTYSSSGIYWDTLKNRFGCDSILKINLKVKTKSFSNIDTVVCSEYVVPSGDTLITKTGIYVDTLTGVNQCDSILNIDLTVNQPTFDSISPSVCRSFVAPDGDTTYKTSGTYYDTLTNNAECDSIIKIKLEVQNVNTKVNRSNEGLSAQADNADYQWLDCNNDLNPISGATNKSFSPENSGKYAVEITQSGCTDTSECKEVNSIGFQTAEREDRIKIFPNPTEQRINLEFKEMVGSGMLLLTDLTGRKLVTKPLNRAKFYQMDVSGIPEGVYILKVETDKKMIRRTIIKQ